MQSLPIARCDKNLDFQPRQEWPAALPAFSWRGELISGFERNLGQAIDLFELQRAPFNECLKAAYPQLGLSELARLTQRLQKFWPTSFREWREGLFQEYELRWSERLERTLVLLANTPMVFQNWVDDKSLGPRDLNVLLALPDLLAFQEFLILLPNLNLSRSEGVKALELGAELFMMGRTLPELLPGTMKSVDYLRQLEKWRRPQTSDKDDQWSETVRQWPWPSQVQGKWQRFGDQAGLDIQIRATSPQDLQKKLERLLSIRETWHDRL